MISTQAPSSYYYLELRFNRTVQFQQKQINFEKGVGVSNLSKHHVANFGIEFTHQKKHHHHHHHYDKVRLLGASLSTTALLLYIGIVTYLPALALEQVDDLFVYY